MIALSMGMSCRWPSSRTRHVQAVVGVSPQQRPFDVVLVSRLSTPGGLLGSGSRLCVTVVDALGDQNQVGDTKIDGQGNDSWYETSSDGSWDAASGHPVTTILYAERKRPRRWLVRDKPEQYPPKRLAISPTNQIVMNHSEMPSALPCL